MKLDVGTNIRKFRRDMGLSQEQLAEAVGVTVGAVSKWESGRACPDISLLPELADFFRISVDVLLGFALQNRTAELVTKRIAELGREKDYEGGVSEAEKALKHFPNNFEVVSACAKFYYFAGMERSDRQDLRHSLELLRRSCTLAPNASEESTLHTSIGEVLTLLGEKEAALAELKKYNTGGMSNATIGFMLSQSPREQDREEARRWLSDSLLDCFTRLLSTCFGLAACNESEAEDICMWLFGLSEGLRRTDGPSYIDRSNARLLAACAQFVFERGDRAAAENYLRRALVFARRYDAAPDAGTAGVRFYCGEPRAFSDDFGETSCAGVQKEVAGTPLEDFWKSLCAE